MKTKLSICSQLNYLIFRTAIAREQKQFIKIDFAVHLSAVISVERYRSESEALKSTIPILVYFYILCNNKSYKKDSGFLRAEPLSSNFEDRSGYRGGKKVISDKSVFTPLTTAPIDDEAKKHNENLPGMGGVFNVVNLHVYHYAGNNPVKYVDPTGMWINNEDGTYTAEKEDTLYGLYGDDWKEKSGFTRDPRTLQVGEIVEKKIILENKKAAITYNDDGIDPNGYTEIFTTKFDWVIKPHGKINLAEADIFYKHRNGVSPNTIVAITGIKIKNIRNFYDRKGRYISSEINYEEIFLLPGEASSK